VVYFKYRKARVVEEPKIGDLEKGSIELEKVVELDVVKVEKIVTNCEQC